MGRRRNIPYNRAYVFDYSPNNNTPLKNVKCCCEIKRIGQVAGRYTESFPLSLLWQIQG
jgi:hypothetical protein